MLLHYFLFTFRMPKKAKHEIYVKKYTKEDLQRAIDEVNNGIPKRVASKKYSIPRATLQFRVSNKFVKSSHGPSPILTSEEESLLVHWIKECHRKGFPRRKEDIQISVKQFLDDTPRPNPFTDNYPGDGWYKAFMRRHPDIALRKTEAITAASSKISETDIKKWFADIYVYLQEKGYSDILKDPNRIFNGDETNFQLCPQNKKVLAPKGSKNVYEIDCGQAKSNITVMFSFSASGITTSPLIIYPYKRLPAEIGSSVPEGFSIACSDSGWMKTEIFYEYIGNTFHNYLKSLNIEFPIILFVDGHKTHLDRKLSDLCTSLKIILIALYPNATRILQPADVSTFKPLKDGWRKGVVKWRQSHPTEDITKKEFASLLKIVIDHSIRPEIVINGFRACGLFPWNPEAIDFSKCVGKNVVKATGDKENRQANNTITFEKFKEIAGNTLLKKFENFASLHETNEVNILYKLWLEFGIPIQKEEESAIESDMETEVVDIDIIEVDREEEPSENLRLTATNSFIEDIQPLKCSLECSTTNQKTGQLVELPNKNIDNTFNIFKGRPLDNFSKLNHEQLVPDENINILNVEFVLEENGKLIEMPEFSKQVVEIKGNTLDEHLYWPKTPERKGVKNTTRVPFVISSTSWKQIKDKQEKEKKLKEQEQENKKREREIKKANKIKEINERKDKRKSNPPKKSKTTQKKTAAGSYRIKHRKNIVQY